MIISQKTNIKFSHHPPLEKETKGISDGGHPRKIPIRNENGLGGEKELTPTTGNDIQDSINAETISWNHTSTGPIPTYCLKQF